MTPPLRTLVIIPTYDEVENLGRIVPQVLAVGDDDTEVDVLVVDDGSPDGTGALADDLAASDPRVHVMHRIGKLGLGSAYVQGFTWGIERGYEVLVEMDADGSHPPEVLGEMLRRLSRDAAALVIGSRWVAGGSVVDWPVHRELLSRGANLYARLLLGMAVRDSTAGYRAYRADVLERVALDEVNSRGYCFQIDMTVRVLDLGGRIIETPIEFRDREFGTSKMSRAIVVEAMTRVTWWGLRRRWRALRIRLGGKAFPPQSLP